MIDKLVSLKEKNKPLFYLVMIILIVPIIALVGLAVVNASARGYLFSSAQKIMAGSKKKDEEIKASIAADQAEINKVDGKLADVDAKIAQVDNDVDENWHKKK